MKNYLLYLVLGYIACAPPQQPNTSAVTGPATDTILPISSHEDITKIIEQEAPNYLIYSWLGGVISENRLANAIPCPVGFDRIKVAPYSFAEWLRFLPIKPKNSPVLLHTGEQKSNQNVHAAVVDINTGTRDLQQCADAVMRLRAEYLYGRKEYAQIHFKYTSGHRVAFDDWSKGRQPRVNGNEVRFTLPSEAVNTSYSNFEAYLQQIFNYAGTASLSKELIKLPIDSIQIGDVFIQGGFPGHAVIVVDMAENEEGERLFLLAQSYMPAQDIHILKNYNDNELNPWYSVAFGEVLETPEWRFAKTDLKRFAN